MNKYRKIGLALVIIIALVGGSMLIDVPYFISSPGEALELMPLVKVEDGFTDEQGEFMMTTVRMGRANLLGYLYSFVNPRVDLIVEELVLRKDEDPEAYFVRQRQVMENSQNISVIVAFEKVGVPIEVTFVGAVVTHLMEEMPIQSILRPGDLITRVEDTPITTAPQLVTALKDQPVGKKVPITIIRDEKQMDVEVEIKYFPENYQVKGEPPRFGIGIISPESKFTISPSKDVHFNTKDIGGPSAGLMFTLEIMNQLVPQDLTKGYHIAGTGTIDEKGNVGSIGGVHQKVVAANKKGADIFFAPDVNHKPTNYDVAKETAERLKLKIEVVPVKTLDDAIKYIQNLPDKSLGKAS